MGVNVTVLRALLYAKALGADFSQTATLGQQSLHIAPEEAIACFKKFRAPLRPDELADIFKSPFSERLLHHLGAKCVHALDASSYQGADIIHDLNRPIPESLKARYSMVIDGGTLEDVFNFPVASSNFIEMTAPGGHILSVVPANNFCGHGFYQFSPELFFRTFSRENGCEVLSLFLASDIPGLPWHQVTDPHLLHSRVTLQNFTPAYLIMLAVRRDLERQAFFIPQQSDYKYGEWNASRAAVPAEKPARPSLMRRLRRLLPQRMQSMLYAMKELILHSGYRKGYKTVTPEALAGDLLRCEGDN